LHLSLNLFHKLGHLNENQFVTYFVQLLLVVMFQL
jgi:hypothetical protein